MGKRSSNSSNGNKAKKYKPSGFIDPNTSGIYATCNRGRELGCRKELMNLLTEKIETMYPDWKEQMEEGDEEDKDDESKLSVEDQIKRELEELKDTKKSKKGSTHPLLHPIELGCECIIFIKTKRPALPADLVHALCEDASISQQKNSRYTQKLTPVTYSVSASMDELDKLAKMVLKPHFHKEDQEPLKFAIQVTRRNFNALEKDDIIRHIAGVVGKDHGHTVDLKQYDKLIMVECYKTNIGMSVVYDFLKFEKYNLQQIFEKNMAPSELSRVGASEKEDKKEEKKE